MTSATLRRLAATVALLICSATPLAAQGPGDELLGATIEPGWHVNSNKPSEDYLIPTEAALARVEGLSFGPPAYPAHKEMKLPFSDTPLALFDGETVIVVEGTAAADASPGPRTLRATLDFQPCNDAQCLAPAQAEATLEIELAPAGTAVVAANAALFPLAGSRGAEATAPAAGGAAPATTDGPSPFAGRSRPAILGRCLLYRSGAGGRGG
ncbi:hypothetical protein EG835_09545, partial [bacterium]|nr:hypothetical protein [bacterium]